MIKKAIQYIKILCEGIEIDPRNPDPLSGEYEKGSKEVADNVLNELGKVPEVFGVYEYNPYGKQGEKWEELAASHSSKSIKDIAEALYTMHEGQIDIRYDSLDGLYEIRSNEKGAPLKIRSDKVDG